MTNREPVRLNDLDWDILSVMADGKRYTPAYLYNDVGALEKYGDDWIRQRVRHLHSEGLIERVGSSSMYVVSDWGRAALELEDEYNDEIPPKEFTQRVLEKSQGNDSRE